MDTCLENSQANEIPEARWANKFNSGFRLCVIELAFYQSTGQSETERVVTRIVTSPEDAKDFLLNLQGTIAEYEEKFGPINQEQ